MAILTMTSNSTRPQNAAKPRAYSLTKVVPIEQYQGVVFLPGHSAPQRTVPVRSYGPQHPSTAA